MTSTGLLQAPIEILITGNNRATLTVGDRFADLGDITSSSDQTLVNLITTWVLIPAQLLFVAVGKWQLRVKVRSYPQAGKASAVP